MEAITKETSRKTKSMESENTIGLEAKHMKANGSITRCMDVGNSNYRTGVFMLVISKRAKDMDMVN